LDDNRLSPNESLKSWSYHMFVQWHPGCCI